MMRMSLDLEIFLACFSVSSNFSNLILGSDGQGTVSLRLELESLMIFDALASV